MSNSELSNLNSSPSPEKTNLIPLLIFIVDNHHYALPIAKVVKVIEMVTIIPVSDVSTIIEGIINVQGQATPVVSAHARVGGSKQPYKAHTPIILAIMSATEDEDPLAIPPDLAEDVADYSDEPLIGLIVDDVQQVVYLPSETLQRTTDKLPSDILALQLPNRPCVAGFTHFEGTIITILDATALLHPSDHEILEQLDIVKWKNVAKET